MLCHRVLADLLAFRIQVAVNDLQLEGADGRGIKPLPPPMLPGNYEQRMTMCRLPYTRKVRQRGPPSPNPGHPVRTTCCWYIPHPRLPPSLPAWPEAVGGEPTGPLTGAGGVQAPGHTQLRHLCLAGAAALWHNTHRAKVGVDLNAAWLPAAAHLPKRHHASQQCSRPCAAVSVHGEGAGRDGPGSRSVRLRLPVHQHNRGWALA